MLLLSTANKAIAGVYDAPHKWTDPKTGKVYVYIPGTPGERLNVKRERAAVAKKIKYDECSIAKVARGGFNPILSLNLPGWNDKSISTIPNQTYSCKQENGNYISSWEGSKGDILETPKAWLIKGESPGEEEIITVVQTATITKKVNNCGILSSSLINGNFSVREHRYNTDTIPEVADPILCVKTKDGHTRYIPDEVPPF